MVKGKDRINIDTPNSKEPVQLETYEINYFFKKNPSVIYTNVINLNSSYSFICILYFLFYVYIRAISMRNLYLIFIHELKNL